ncbi:MAG: PQQ-dependent sugar dehydrogenase, partial [Gammaproteobacteria bacterium]|nr:PQQ-dependent sugar dehydrogenase [Gammaproteobacteria bacterium]
MSLRASFARVTFGLTICAFPIVNAGAVESSEKHTFDVNVIVDGLEHPWSLAFLPDNRLLVTERSGRLRVVQGGRLLSAPVAGLPPITEHGQGGLMDILLHSDFEQNRVIFLSFTARGDAGYGTEIARARFLGDHLEDVEIIFRARPKRRGGQHFGSRLAMLADGTLLITLGDRGHRPNGQNLGSHPGSIIRI